jgi:hypothetical protein
MFMTSLRAFRDLGVQVVAILASNGPLSDALRDDGIHHETVPFMALRKLALREQGAARFTFSLLREAIRLAQVVRDHRPAAVYANTIIAPQWILAARLAGVPVICHVHELATDMSFNRARVLYAPLRLATLTIANSYATRELFVRAHPALARRSVTIPNGIPLPPYVAPRPGRRGPVHLLVVGRLSVNKGQDVAIRAVAMLVARGCDVVLDLVGGVFPGYEQHERELVGLVEELGLRERVRFLGYRDELRSSYAEADIVLVPSRMESFGLVAVEAMASGRPVIASAVGGLAEIVRAGSTGWLVPPEDAAALAAGVLDVLDDPGSTQAIVDRAADVVRRDYSVASYSASLASALESVGAR